MYHTVVLLLLLLFHKLESLESPEEGTSHMLRKHFYDGHKIVLPLSKSASIQLLDHWIQQAASGFLAAFASKRLI